MAQRQTEIQKKAQLQQPPKGDMQEKQRMPKADILPSDGPERQGRQEGLDNDLINAARKGTNTEIKRLIEAGADIATTNQWGWTTLHWAAGNGRTQICALIIQEYAKSGRDAKSFIVAKDSDRKTAADWAEKTLHTQTVEFLKTMEWLADATGNEFMKSFAECAGI